VSTFERQSGVAVSYERSGDPVRVDDQTAIHVYRILQEALANVARHSGSRQAAVRLRSRGRSIELEVEDRGCGFSPHTSRRGLGLVAMRERAALLGGTLTVEGGPDGGTRVRLIVPLKTPSAVA
jgi:signal transduction histidine kinase